MANASGSARYATKGVSWKFILDAKRSIFGVTLSWLQARLKNSLFRHHSVHLLNVRYSLSASMFSWPGMRAIVSHML